MSEEDRQDRAIIDTGDFKGNHWAGFVSAYSRNAPSSTSTAVGSRLCLKNRELSTYCGKQFIDLWADFKLIRSAECDY